MCMCVKSQKLVFQWNLAWLWVHILSISFEKFHIAVCHPARVITYFVWPLKAAKLSRPEWIMAVSCPLHLFTVLVFQNITQKRSSLTMEAIHGTEYENFTAKYRFKLTTSSLHGCRRYLRWTCDISQWYPHQVKILPSHKWYIYPRRFQI